MPPNILNLSFSSLEPNENISSSTKDIQQSSFSSLNNTQKLSWSMLQRHTEQQGEKPGEEEEKKDDGTVPTNESSDDEDMNTSHNSLHLSFDEAMITSSAHGSDFNNHDNDENDNEEEESKDEIEAMDRIRFSNICSDSACDEGKSNNSCRNNREEENPNFTEQRCENDEISTPNDSLHLSLNGTTIGPADKACLSHDNEHEDELKLEGEELAMDMISRCHDSCENDCDEDEDSRKSISSSRGSDDNDITATRIVPQIEIQNMPALLVPSLIEFQERVSFDPYRVDSDSMSTGNIDYQWRNNTTESKKNGHEAYITSRDVVCILDASVRIRNPEEMTWRRAYWEEKTEVEKLANALFRLDKPDYHGVFGANEFAHPLQRTSEEEQLHYCCDASSVGGETSSHHSNRSRNRKISRGSHYHDDDNYSDCSSISASMRSSFNSRTSIKKRRSSRMSGKAHSLRRSSTGTLPHFIMDCVEEEEGCGGRTAFDNNSSSCGRSRSSRSEFSYFSATFSLTSSLSILGNVLSGKRPNSLRLPSSNSSSKKRQFIDLTLADDAASNASSDLDDDEETKSKTSIGTCLRRYSAGFLFGGLNSRNYEESLEDIDDDMSCITSSSFSIRGHRNSHHQRIVKQWNEDTKIATSTARNFIDLTDGRDNANSMNLRGNASFKSLSNSSIKSIGDLLDLTDNNTDAGKNGDDEAGENDDTSDFECSASSLTLLQRGDLLKSPYGSIRKFITTVEATDSNNENIEADNDNMIPIFSGDTEGTSDDNALHSSIGDDFDSDDEDDYDGFIEGWENAANSALIKEAHDVSYELEKDLRERGYESPYHDVNKIFPSFSSLHDRLKPMMIEHIVIEDELHENDEAENLSVEEGDDELEQRVVEEKSNVKDKETKITKETAFVANDAEEESDETSMKGLKARMMEHLNKKSHLLRREKAMKSFSPGNVNSYLKNFFYEKRSDGICSLPKILGEIGLDKRLSVDTIQVAKEIIDELTSPLRLRKPDEKVEIPGRKSVTFAMNHIISAYDEFGHRKSKKNLM